MRFFRCATWIVVFGSINSILATLQFVEQPRSDTITEGQTYVLTCKLNELVNCTWNRNEALTTITDRYRYISNNGTNTKDCSVEILTTSAEFDAASWQCTADNRDGIAHSDKVFLVVQRNMNQTQLNVWIVEQPKNASVAHGQNHTLTCKFNEPVNCIWTRSQSAMEIKDRYQYLNNNGIDSKDCSFRITNFGHADAAPWQCTARHGPGKYYTKEAVSNVVFLSTLSVPTAPLKLVEQPKNETVDSGQVHTLYCTFNAPINCSWDRNGTDTVINGRYSYISNNGINTKDCSFQISSFLEELDAHVWKCKAFDPSRSQLVASDNVFLAIQRNTHSSRSTLGITEAGVKVVEQPTSVTVNEGEPAVLDCKFSELVDCAWNSTNVNNQYHYVSNDGKHTKDCSIKITNVTTAHAETWECNGKVISDVKRIVSNKVNLHVKNQYNKKLLQAPKDVQLHANTDIPLVEQPQNASVFIGHDHHLICIYSMPVDCIWNRNGILVTIEGRYHYGNDNGRNTANCSLLITNFKTDHDDGYWECKAEVSSDITLKGLSDKAYLSVQNIVSPNRTAILLNGNPVTEIWVPTNGSQNGTLQCVAEYAIPQANLYWNVTGKIYSEGSPDTEIVCSQSYYCNSTLTWIGDWNQLLNYSTLSCFILQLNSSTIVTASLKRSSDPKVSSSSLSAGAIAGIVIAVLFILIIIIGILVYFFVMKPRKTKNVQHNVTMAPSYDKNSGTIDIKASHPSPAISEKSKANSTPGHSAETVRMNDRQPQAVPQSPVKVPLIKKVEGESKPNNNTEDSDDEAVEAKPDLNMRYSTPFAYIGGKDIFPVKKMDGNQT